MRNEFRTVIAANIGRLAFLPNDFLHESNQASCRYGMRNFLCDGHTVAIVDDIEYAEIAVALQNVSNEVHRPGDIFLVRCHERILDTGRQAFAQRLSLVEMNRQFASVILAHASMVNTTFGSSFNKGKTPFCLVMNSPNYGDAYIQRL